MIAPYGSVGTTIPVTVLTKGQLTSVSADTALITLTVDSGHGHAPGMTCIACVGRLDVRARLFDVLEEVRQGLRPRITNVVVDASALVDVRPVLDAIAGRLPATALRDHTVARNFYLAQQAV
ncbi:hypothetical protein PSQ19_03930 [Devosia algicola]|uniref:STAS domain-containing protein n=1 Tax=Devosia algicola TaxID=3026418 RepID=A0ABY7YPU5_9HYPH|nr:hypothetical protein [Devosia algicola]WDR03311.1 hypothetical protein PSQ19_03930 [Devosia algicola]